jgi:nitrite reductase/ring-hydroxylating ferredoxin subunit
MTTSLGRLDDFALDTPTPVQVDGKTCLVIRRSEAPDEVCVIPDACPHVGLSLTKGPRGGYADGVITCAWHNSRFDVCTGENLDWTPGVAGIRVPGWSRRLVALGKAPTPLEVLPVSVIEGEVVLDR